MYCRRNETKGYDIIIVRRSKKKSITTDCPGNILAYEPTKWCDRLSTSLITDHLVDTTDAWHPTPKDVKDNWVYTTLKSRNAAECTIHMKDTTDNRKRRPRRKRGKFQQTRWGMVLCDDPEQGRSDWVSRK
jgi:hypothetical protein